jgi:hypothetical protein
MGQIWRTSMPTATDFSEVQSDTEIRGYLSKAELIYKSLSHSPTHNVGEKTKIDAVSQKSFAITTMKNFQSESYAYTTSSTMPSVSDTSRQPIKNLPSFALDTDTIVDSQMRWTAEQIVNYLARVKTLEDIQELLKQDQFRKIYEQMRLYLMNDKWRERFIYYIDKVVARKRLGFKQMSNMYHALGILTVWSDALTDLG